MTTFMPASVNARAMPKPMPLSPPVMKATLPSTSRIGVGTDGQLPGASAAAATERPAGTRPAAADAAVARAAVPKNPRRDCPPGVSASPFDGLSLFWLMRDSLIVGPNRATGHVRAPQSFDPAVGDDQSVNQAHSPPASRGLQNQQIRRDLTQGRHHHEGFPADSRRSTPGSRPLRGRTPSLPR